MFVYSVLFILWPEVPISGLLVIYYQLPNMAREKERSGTDPKLPSFLQKVCKANRLEKG